MKKFNYALFYDFHTPATIPDVGVDFDAEAFTDQVKECGVDFLTWHARCNQGSAYYDTKFGTKHPSLKFDMIRELGEACHRKGITLSVYFNGHLSDEELMHHPEWLAIGMDGVTIDTSRGPFTRMVCYNSGFRDHLINMVTELAENYPVDGFFFDCLGTNPCICPTCLAEMKAKGMDYRDRDALVEFSHQSVQRMCEDLNAAIRKIKPDALLFFNGRPFEEVIHMESHLECECLPTAAWGYECLPLCAHYMRTVAGPDKCVLNMTGRFNDWGDFGGLRTAVGLEYDLFYGMANGQRPDIGGHFHPRCGMELPVFERIKEVYSNLQQYDEWVIDAVNNPEVALVYPRGREYYYPNSMGLKAAIRMLTELKVQFDVVSEFVQWDKYKLLIFPDDVVFNDEITRRVEDHLARGGKVIASSRSGLDATGEKFAIPSWPAIYEGETENNPFYFMPAGKLAVGLPQMPLSIYASGSKVRSAEGATAQMFCVKPYLTPGWDGLRTNYYNAPDAVSDEPFLVQKGNVAYFSGEIFTGYSKRAPIQLRQLLAAVMNELLPELKLRTANLPSFGRAFVQEKGNTEIVHLLAYCPEQRCQATALEDRITVLNAEISLRTDGRQVSKVYLAPNRQELPHQVKDGYCTVTLPQFTSYALLVFEYK